MVIAFGDLEPSAIAFGDLEPSAIAFGDPEPSVIALGERSGMPAAGIPQGPRAPVIAFGTSIPR